MSKVIEMLKRHEGLSLKPYRDSVGVLTIGYGRNLEHNGISAAEAEHLLGNDLQAVITELDRTFPWFGRLNTPRADAIIDMAFNLGLPRFREFKRMIAAVAAERWEDAAREALDSRWARQVGNRAEEIAFILETGEYP